MKMNKMSTFGRYYYCLSTTTIPITIILLFLLSITTITIAQHNDVNNNDFTAISFFGEFSVNNNGSSNISSSGAHAHESSSGHEASSGGIDHESSSSSGSGLPSNYQYELGWLAPIWGDSSYISADPLNDNLYIIDLYTPFGSRVRQIDANGNAIGTTYLNITLVVNFSHPILSMTSGLYVDTERNIYCSCVNYTNDVDNWLLKFNSSGQLIYSVYLPNATIQYITRGYAPDGEVDNLIAVSITQGPPNDVSNGIYRYHPNGTLFSITETSLVPSQFAYSEDGWIYGSTLYDSYVIFDPTGKEAVLNGELESPLLSVDKEMHGVAFDESVFYMVYRNGSTSGVLGNTTLSEPGDITALPNQRDIFYVKENHYQFGKYVIVYDTSNASVLNTIQPPDMKYPVTSITSSSDEVYIYLALNYSKVLKLNITDSQEVLLADVTATDGSFSGIRQHPINGDLYILDYQPLSSGPQFHSWTVTRLDSNLTVISKMPLSALMNETMLSTPFAFDSNGLMYQLVPSTKCILVIDPLSGASTRNISLANIVMIQPNLTYSIWIGKSDSSLFITLPDQNQVVQINLTSTDGFADFGVAVMTTYSVSNPTAVTVNSNGYVFIISNFSTLMVFSDANPTSLVTSYDLVHAGPNTDDGTITAVDICTDSLDNIFIARRNSTSLILFQTSPTIPSSSSTGSGYSSSSSGYSSSSSTGASQKDDDQNVGLMVGIGVGGLAVGIIAGLLIGMKCWRKAAGESDESLLDSMS